MKATFQAAAAALLLLLVAAPLASSEAGWNDPNIVLEGNPQKWVQLEEPAPGAPKPFPPLDDRWTRDDTSVVVLVASARETRCGETLFNLFSKAHNPERVYFGVVQQNAPTDEDCVEGTEVHRSCSCLGCRGTEFSSCNRALGRLYFPVFV